MLVRDALEMGNAVASAGGRFPCIPARPILLPLASWMELRADVERLNRFDAGWQPGEFLTVYTNAGPLTFGHGEEAMI